MTDSYSSSFDQILQHDRAADTNGEILLIDDTPVEWTEEDDRKRRAELREALGLGLEDFDPPCSFCGGVSLNINCPTDEVTIFDCGSAKCSLAYRNMVWGTAAFCGPELDTAAYKKNLRQYWSAALYAVQVAPKCRPAELALASTDYSNHDPGPLPVELQRVPGFISAVMDHTLEIAPYPNQILALTGAMALQASLAGRKVDFRRNRTNFYFISLAHSGAGKDAPRRVNKTIMARVGLIDALGEQLGSGEGLEDQLFLHPASLFQIDELDTMLRSMTKGQDARQEIILGKLLTLYTSSNTIWKMRAKAGKTAAAVIDQPHLVILGSACPETYYQALSSRLLANGFFARTIVLEAGSRGPGQDAGTADPPQQVIETAQWWADQKAGSGNLASLHPGPRVVEADDAADRLLTEARLVTEAEYSAAEGRNDAVGTTCWARAAEQLGKLALLYAVSVNHEAPRIDAAAVNWAREFAFYGVRRMLAQAGANVADSPFHAECLKLLKKLREAPGRELSHSLLLRRMKTDARTFVELIRTLHQQEAIDVLEHATAGRTKISYRLCDQG